MGVLISTRHQAYFTANIFIKEVNPALVKSPVLLSEFLNFEIRLESKEI
jgi:hypothetical protein